MILTTFFQEAGINHPVTTISLFVILAVCGVAFSRIREERSKSISATEMHQMDPIVNGLGFGMVLVFILILLVVGV